MNENNLWITFWICVSLVLVVLLSGLVYANVHENAQRIAGQDYYAAHCSIVDEIISQNGNGTGTITYACKGAK